MSPAPPNVRRRFVLRKLFELAGALVLVPFLAWHLTLGSGSLAPAERPVRPPGTFGLVLEGLFLAALLYHAGWGLASFRRVRSTLSAYGHARNWFFVLQRVTGPLLLLFLAYHVWALRLAPALDGTPPDLRAHLAAPVLGYPARWVYQVALGVAAFHWANGLVNAAIHLGLLGRPLHQRLALLLCFTLGAALFTAGTRTLFHLAP